MKRTLKYFARLLAPALLLIGLVACGGTTAMPTASITTPTSEGATISGPGDSPGIDQTKLDVCAMIPRAAVENVIGPLHEAPKAKLAIGAEVGCEYASETHATTISVYNLDRWDLFTKGLEGTSVAGIGDAGFLVKEGDGSHTLYVLLRDRAVVGVWLATEDMQGFRQLVNVTVAQLHS